LFIKEILMRVTILSILILGTLSLAATAGADEINGIAVVVNDEIITSRELAREYDKAFREFEKREAFSGEASQKLRSKVLDSMVDRILIRQKIKELNIVLSEEEVRQSIEDVKRQNRLSQEELTAALISQGMTFDQYKAQMKEQLERLRLMSQEVKSKVQVDEKEIKVYYDANLANFSDEEAYRARAIFLRLAETAPPEEIRAAMLKFEAASAEIRKNSNFAEPSKKLVGISTPEEIRAAMFRFEAASAAARRNGNFAELAKKYSDDEIAQKDGGDLGVFKKSEMTPEIEKIVLSIRPGEVETIAVPGGIYIIKLEEKNPGIVKPFEAVKGEIEERLYQEKSEARFAKWLEELRKGAAIDIK
jgi:peptidyl-prolyl cis-trans isomerase SurA